MGNANDKGKNVHLALSLDESMIRFVVKDEGEGFDYENLPDPTCPRKYREIRRTGNFFDEAPFR
jgi:serine/threonine-protein kinase RsbW